MEHSALKGGWLGLAVWILGIVAGVGHAAPLPMTIDKVYVRNCQACHAKDGTGNPRMLKTLKVEPSALNIVDADTLKKTDTALGRVISDGFEKKMPMYAKKLTEGQIKDLVAYIRTLAATTPAAR